MSYARRAMHVFALALLIATASASAQTYPERAIQLIVPFPPGGPADIVARPLADRLAAVLGQPIVVLNKPGASGTLGAAFVAKAASDGYTLLLGTSNELTMSPGLYTKLPYDPIRDFAPITTVILFPNVLVVNKDVPARSAKELAALTRAKPGELSYGTSGTGSTNHLTTEVYRAATGVEVNYVPYRGGAPAMADLLGGQIQAMFATMPSSTGLINSGALRALMVTDAKRWPAIPDVPSATEAGLPEVQIISFNGVLAPAGTPGPVIAKLHDAITRVMTTPEMVKLMAEQAGAVSTSTPAAFAAMLKDDYARWLSVIKSNGIHVD